MPPNISFASKNFKVSPTLVGGSVKANH